MLACVLAGVRALLAYVLALLGSLLACRLLAFWPTCSACVLAWMFTRVPAGFLLACVCAGLLACVRACLFLLACMSACPLTCFCGGRFYVPVGDFVRQAAVPGKGGAGLRFFARWMFRRERWVVLKKNNLLTLA